MGCGRVIMGTGWVQFIRGGDNVPNDTKTLDKCQLIWQGYRVMWQQTRVIRSGPGLYGVYDYDPNQIITAVRPQSDAEHVYGLSNLVMLIAIHFPEYIPSDQAFEYIMAVKTHELGENVIGDVPDDGKCDAAWKNAQELKVVTEFENSFLAGKNTGCAVFFKEFQQRSTPRGRKLYACDKLEAILTGLMYEAAGCGGDIRNKSSRIELSDQDKRNMQRTGSTALVDIWSAHFLDATQGMLEAELPRLILRAAVEDVRKAWFPWAE